MENIPNIGNDNSRSVQKFLVKAIRGFCMCLLKQQMGDIEISRIGGGNKECHCLDHSKNCAVPIYVICEAQIARPGTYLKQKMRCDTDDLSSEIGRQPSSFTKLTLLVLLDFPQYKSSIQNVPLYFSSLSCSLNNIKSYKYFSAT